MTVSGGPGAARALETLGRRLVSPPPLERSRLLCKEASGVRGERVERARA